MPSRSLNPQPQKWNILLYIFNRHSQDSTGLYVLRVWMPWIGKYCRLATDLLKISRCHVCSLIATGLPPYFVVLVTQYSSQREAEWLNMPHLQTAGLVLMDENDTLSHGQHDVEPLNIYPSISLSPINLFVYLILSANWSSGERVPPRGQAPGRVRCPDWHYSAEEADHWQQDQGGEGEMKARSVTADTLYFPLLFFIFIFHFIFSHFLWFMHFF